MKWRIRTRSMSGGARSPWFSKVAVSRCRSRVHSRISAVWDPNEADVRSKYHHCLGPMRKTCPVRTHRKGQKRDTQQDLVSKASRIGLGVTRIRHTIVICIEAACLVVGQANRLQCQRSPLACRRKPCVGPKETKHSQVFDQRSQHGISRRYPQVSREWILRHRKDFCGGLPLRNRQHLIDTSAKKCTGRIRSG